MTLVSTPRRTDVAAVEGGRLPGALLRVRDLLRSSGGGLIQDVLPTADIEELHDLGLPGHLSAEQAVTVSAERYRHFLGLVTKPGESINR